MELLEIAKEHAESTDWNKSVQVVKRIQSDWKKLVMCRENIPIKFGRNSKLHVINSLIIIKIAPTERLKLNWII